MAGKNTVKHAFFAAVLLLAGASVLSGSYVKQYAAEPAASLTEEGPAETGDNITGDEAVVSVTDDLDREVSVPSGMIKAAALTASFAQTWLLAGGEICAAPHDAWEDLDLNTYEDGMVVNGYIVHIEENYTTAAQQDGSNTQIELSVKLLSRSVTYLGADNNYKSIFIQ